YPERQHMQLVTTGEEDWTHEYKLAPWSHLEKEYDVITINRIIVDFKNPGFFAEVLKTYEKKYNYRLKVLMPVDLYDLSLPQPRTWGIKDRFQDFCQRFDNVADYVKFVPLVSNDEMSKYYS